MAISKQSTRHNPVAAQGHGAATLKRWQQAIIAAFQNGLGASAACADAQVSIALFRDSYTHDQAFRDACLAAAAVGRASATAAPAPRAPTPATPKQSSRALPEWAGAFLRALLAGEALEAAAERSGVRLEEVQHERRRNLLFRQAFQAASGAGSGQVVQQSYGPLLDRVIADAVVAARALAPHSLARSDWQGALLRALRGGSSPDEAARAASVDPPTVAAERERNPMFAHACDLITIFAAGQEEMSADRHVPLMRPPQAQAEDLQARENALADAFLRALAGGATPRAAARRAGWGWDRATRRRDEDQAFRRAWEEADGRPRPHVPSEQAVSLREQRRAVLARALATLRAGGTIREVASAAGVGKSTLYEWLQQDRVFKASWEVATEQGRAARAAHAAQAAAEPAPPTDAPEQAPAHQLEAAEVDVPDAPALAAAEVAVPGSEAAPTHPGDSAADAEALLAENEEIDDWALQFLSLLERQGSVTAAARALGLTSEAVNHRYHADAPFRAAMNQSLAVVARHDERQAAGGGGKTGNVARPQGEEEAPWERAFLAALRSGARVDQAARRARTSVAVVYTRRRENERFRVAWDNAQQEKPRR